MNKEKRKLLKAENKFLKAQIKMLQAQIALFTQEKTSPQDDLLKMSPVDYFVERGLLKASKGELASPDVLNPKQVCIFNWLKHAGKTMEDFLSIRTSFHINKFHGIGITKVHAAQEILLKDGLSFDNPERIEELNDRKNEQVKAAYEKREAERRALWQRQKDLRNVIMA
tara:strand:+ start:1100 stop:1606 length:507 start_codon:yes stop_codon:yes gene_type:complete